MFFGDRRTEPFLPHIPEAWPAIYYHWKSGRGSELLKTVSTRISLHFSQTRGIYSFFI